MGRDGDAADTIAAISTGVGPGAIGIVRLSGPRAVDLAQMAFRPARGVVVGPGETHRLLYGHVVDPATGQVVDEALLAVMRAPRTYTREDVAEVHCHGGAAAQRAVLRLLLGLGARLAGPGEFTRRAFLNGRIDLAQAESVAALIGARSSAALRASVRQLQGGLSEKVRAVRRELVALLAGIEAAVDFADEDVDEVGWEAVSDGLEGVRRELKALLRTAFVGRALEQGVHTAIVGKPNVGKSSLLNALLMRERAIVSDIPGTTRDTVEELLEIDGLPIHLVDTAGLRVGGDHVERLGVERTRKAMEQADVVLAVVDVSDDVDESDLEVVSELDPERTIVVGNKSDLARDAGVCCARVRIATEALGRGIGRGGEGAGGWCVVSASTGEGLDELRARIWRVVTHGEQIQVEAPILANERQRALVAAAVESTEAALEAVRSRVGEELVCEDVRAAANSLGRITGEELAPDVLDEIFSRFCIGK
jgi:tRNA modification GTPase